ncbi:hypothetical protein WICPIJ_005570 [Wickerhamomyces pijperi]|uniref:pH-response regulator protein palH/RIM21 n=1 Tax=Wickerhamomyces pijperi TaxID=599730 RepID=A0A9P8TM81_WICPI|nr:hypothetical protein WICPIJ_005570 [Wickerhamomyces pijperi]
MAFGTNLVWRYPTSSTNPPSCQAQGIPLDNGYILLNPLDIPHLILLENQIYHPLCYNGVPLLSTFKDLGAQTLPMISNDWIRFINNDEWGSFKFTVYSIIYSLTVATVMAIFLTIIVFTNHTQKPSWLLRLSSLMGSVNLTILFVRSIIYLEKQHTLGISSGVKLLDDLQSDQVFNAIDFIFVLLAQFAEVQVIIRLFSRAKEKRVSFLVGGALSLAAQIIWAVSTFSNINIDDEESNLSILPAFTYLLRIALSTVYSGLIVIYAISKRSYIFHRSVVLLTLLNFLVINLQIAFFVTDISNIWVSELSEIFNTTVYICVTVIPWEWINRVHAIERHEQKEGVLGRPFYEDEDRAVIRYEIIDDTELFSDDHGNNTGHLEEMAHHEEQDHHHQQQQQIAGSASDDLSPPSRIYTPFHKLKTSINTTTNTLLYLTDQVIAYGLAVPRSVSTDSTTITTRSRTPMAVVKHSKQSKIKGKFGKIIHGKNVVGDSSSGDSSSNNHHRKEVFVYSKREVVCDDLISAVSTNTSSSNSDSTSSVGTSGVMMDSHIAGNSNMEEGLDSIIYEDGSERR